MIEIFSKRNKMKWLISFVLSILTVTWANASHLRAGEITIERKVCNSNELWITLTIYTNNKSDVKTSNQGRIYFGDGEFKDIGIIQNIVPLEGFPDVSKATYLIKHIYAAIGAYTIGYVEANRNGGVKNMADSFNETFYLETRFDLATLGCNYSPKLKIPPIDQACAGVAFYHNPGAYDFNPVGPTDSLSYELKIPLADRTRAVVGYISPEIYNAPAQNEVGGAATFTIDPVDGTIVWDAPKTPGEYNIAFYVIEWRKTDGVWRQIGYVRRDMQIIVIGNCLIKRPFLTVPDDTCVVAGAFITKDITAFDNPENNPQLKVRLQAYSEVLEFPTSKSPASIDGDTTLYNPSPTSITFNWQTICAHIKGQAYDVVFKSSNQPANGHDPYLATFEGWKIKVIAPAPVLTSAVNQSPQRSALLTWDSYDCADISDETTAMQIWRKIDDTSYTPSNCVTGMPAGLGFSLIANVPLTDTQYLDTNGSAGLERGVKYCYRLVAVFGNRGAESYVSNEQCIEPIEIAAPLITKVSVLQTSETDGRISVSWLPPINNFEIRNEIEFDQYEYQLERAESDGFITVSPKIAGSIDSTAVINFIDGGIASGLNTFDQQYAYRVMLYVMGSPDPIDSSSLASSVWLDLTTSNKRINLSWRATVPWSNQIDDDGYEHLVYVTNDVTVTQLSDFATFPSDSIPVNVFTDGLRYSALGLDSTQTYCYAVVTKGSYGNDNAIIKAQEPLSNRSQINCAKPIVTKPPCEPVIQAFGDPCQGFKDGTYGCNSVDFKVTVRWSMPSGTCEDGIRGYKLYISSTQDGNFYPYNNGAILTDTFAVINDQLSLAFCFKVVAIDRSGNESGFSDIVCSENCPNYELPNVFTPNGDRCNDLFSAYGLSVEPPEGGGTPLCDVKPDDVLKCARFVERVDFKVYNRWGKKIYDYIGQTNNENNIYINWNGKDNGGKDVAAGIYYYSAEVTFQSTKSKGTIKTLKGWVHLVR